jgi:hypothetical protein
MRALVLPFISLLFCFLLAGCVAPSTILICVVDRYGTPQPYARVGAQWLHRMHSADERVIVLQDGTDEHGRFTMHDIEVPDFIDVWSPDTGRSATLYHVKWGYNVIVLR